MSEPIYDFAGIGVGPFNLGLACLTEPIDGLNGVLFDQGARFDWHPGMLLEDATLQTPFLSDLVTLADPTSRFSFLNYLKRQGRLYAFYIRENFFLLRSEYNQYCQWAAEQLPNVHFESRVDWVEYDSDRGCYAIHVTGTRTGHGAVWRARRLVLGTGTVPYIPDTCRDLGGEVLHTASYLQRKPALQRKRAITVVGSGQSAAEVFHDLLKDIDTHGYRLSWFTRSPRFFPLEYSKLTLEMTSPEYVDYFYGLPERTRDRLNQEHKKLYKGIDDDLIRAIHELLYTKSLTHEIEVDLRPNSALQRAAHDERSGGLELELFQWEQEQSFQHRTDALILATGYTYRMPEFIDGIAERIKWDERGHFDVERNYSIDRNGGEIFVQNAELHTHGFVTPDLGMGCYRNSYIIREMTGREHYPIERTIAFQSFGVHEHGEDDAPSASPASAWRGTEVC